MHAVLVLFRPPPNVGIQNFGRWGMYTLVKAYRSIQNPSPIAESRTGKPAMVTLNIQLDCSTVHDTTLWANIYVRSHVGCGTDFFSSVLQVSQIFQRCKSDAKKQDFENTLNLTFQAQSTHKTIMILTKVFWTFGPNSVVLAWKDEELSRRQAQKGVNFDFEGKFDLEGKGQSPPKTIGTLTKVFNIYGSNLVILARTGLELSRGQASDWHGRTNRRRQRQYPMAIQASGENEAVTFSNQSWHYFVTGSDFPIRK